MQPGKTFFSSFLALMIFVSGALPAHAQTFPVQKFSGQIEEITFNPETQKHQLKIKFENDVSLFEIDPTTKILKPVKAQDIVKGDHIISDRNGSLLPVDFSSNLNPPQRPENKRPPEKPDQSKPQDMAPPPPDTKAPHEGETPPPAPDDSGMPPPENTSEDQAEKPSEPKKKPWEIELENAVEPEDSLNLATHPLSTANETEIGETNIDSEETVLHEVEKVDALENGIQLDTRSKDGKNQKFEIPKEQLIYHLVNVEALEENTIVEIAVSEQNEKRSLILITILQ